MAAPRVETIIQYLSRHVWRRACFMTSTGPKRFRGFRETIVFVSRIFWSLLTSRCEILVWECPNTAMQVRTIGLRQRFSRYKLEWVRLFTSSELDGVGYKRYQQRKNRPHGLVSLSEHVENHSSKISNKINEYRLSSSLWLSEQPRTFKCARARCKTANFL